MAQGVPDVGNVDDVQIFDTSDLLNARPDLADLVGKVGMATSPNCDITVLQTAPQGRLQLPVDPDADLILFVLQGAARVEGSAGEQEVGVNQGVLVPADTAFACTNPSDENLLLLSLRTGSPVDRPGYVPNQPSGVKIRLPEAEISADGIGRHLYVFAMNKRTIGVGVNATEEWNLGSLLRMNCQFERVGDDIVVNLPERMARWYQVRDLTDADYRIITDPARNRVRVDLTPLLEREAGA